jgi:hypothetical protein
MCSAGGGGSSHNVSFGGGGGGSGGCLMGFATDPLWPGTSVYIHVGRGGQMIGASGEDGEGSSVLLDDAAGSFVTITGGRGGNGRFGGKGSADVLMDTLHGGAGAFHDALFYGSARQRALLARLDPAPSVGGHGASTTDVVAVAADGHDGVVGLMLYRY